MTLLLGLPVVVKIVVAFDQISLSLNVPKHDAAGLALRNFCELRIKKLLSTDLVVPVIPASIS
jgi:hypothetical protein